MSKAETMTARRYAVKLTGATQLLMHADSVEWADELERFRKDPSFKKESKAGDDRSPAWTWIGYLYKDQGVVAMPSDNLMTMLREGGAKVPTGKKQETFKRLSQSGLMLEEASWPLVTARGETVPMEKIEPLLSVRDYAEHKATVGKLGFELFERRARVGQAKHVRVRPRFGVGWTLAGTVTVLEPMITQPVLEQILNHAGAYCGLGDWRPSSPSKPGLYGRFSAEVKAVAA